MPQWTPEQLLAIEADNNELLISAAAGSGKTAVLIERILRLLRLGTPLNRMVIVTFTNAAGAQLRERLQKKLSEASQQGDLVARAQLDLLPVTQIGTIHSFCGAILKTYFHVVGIDPACTQMDGARGEKMMLAAMELALDELTEDPSEAFAALTRAFSDKDMADMARSLYQFMMSLKAPFEWLENKTGESYSAQGLQTHPFTTVLVTQCRVCLHGLDAEKAAYEAEMNSPFASEKWDAVVKSDLALLENLQQVESLPDLNALFDVKFQTAPRVPKADDALISWHEGIKARRDRLKAGVLKAKALLPTDLDKDAADLNAMRQHLLGLKDLVERFHALFMAMKQRENVLDFNDLIHYTLAVLKDPQSRLSLQEACDHLFVDEYQDVGDAEEGIFQAIHTQHNHLFMVGDVKQSIYRFRLCDPTLFLRKQDAFSLSPDAAQRKIFLNRNFRSQPRILATVNTVFETLLKRSVTELDYDADAHLYPGREGSDSPQAQLHLIEMAGMADKDGEKPDKLEGEFQKVAALIREQMTQPLLDEKRGTQRPTRYRDMAILLPKAKGVAFKLQESLQKQGIPSFADNDENYFDLPEITRMMALLHTLDNPRQDIPFLAVTKLPMIDFTDEELADIRLHTPSRKTPFYDAFVIKAKDEDALGEKCSKTLQWIEKWRFLSGHMGLDALVWDLMKESGLYLAYGAKKGGSLRQANLRMLCEYACQYQSTSHGGLHGFLLLSDQIGDKGDSKTAKELSERDDLVRIMTIHKSKGLEFPIVFLMGLGSPMQLAEKRKLRPHKELGLGIPYVDAQKRITRKTLAQKAITARNEMEDKAERARLLYVGMTRAQERLLMLGTVQTLKRDAFMLAGEYGVFAAQTYLDWLMIVPGCYQRLVNSVSTGYPQPAEPYTISVCDVFEEQLVEKSESLSTALSALLTLPDPLVVEKVARLLNETPTQRWPLKTSVSALVKNVPFLMAEESVETKALGNLAMPPLTLPDLPDAPAFLKPRVFSAADRGSAVHLALSKLDYQSPLLPQLQAMRAKGLYTDEQFNSVPIAWLTAFQNSDLCRRMQKSSMVKREWAFNIKLFKDQNTLVQGVVDLCFWEADGFVLCDYKTDRDPTAHMLTERYGDQVRLYAKALTLLTGKPVAQTWLFALLTGEAIQVI